jgi:hypothetical protein
VPTKKKKVRRNSRVYIHCEVLVGTRENPVLIPTSGRILKVLDWFKREGENFVVVRFSSKKLHLDRKLTIRKKFVSIVKKKKEKQDVVFRHKVFINETH